MRARGNLRERNGGGVYTKVTFMITNGFKL